LPRLHRARPSAALDDLLILGPLPTLALAHLPRGAGGCPSSEASTAVVVTRRAWRRGRVGAVGPVHDWRSFDACSLAALKADRGWSVSVVVPALDEEATIGRVVSCVADRLVAGTALVDELVVVDDGSSDTTAAEARSAGARVISLPCTRGKGAAMTAGLHATVGDVVVYCDGDVHDFTERFVTGLVGPLFTDPGLVLVKGTYRRPLGSEAGQGGRVTELVAKPLIRLLFPHLAAVAQPLAGESALWRWALEGLQLEDGYGVELALLIDIAQRYGTEAIGQCDLGERRHRNRPLEELAPQAATVMNVALGRAGLLPLG